jgi:DNA-binding XRE family transcriptional regulator
VKKKPTFGERVRAARLDMLLTQPQFARWVGVSRPTIARIERGDPIADLTRARIEKMLSQKVEAA